MTAVVQNGFSVPSVQALSVNAITTIFGTSFLPAGAATQNSALVGGKVPTNFQGVCVTVGGVQAPMLQAGPTQVGILVPALGSAVKADIVVYRNCGTSTELKSAAFSAPVQTATPELIYLAYNPDGKNPVAAQNSAYAWVTPDAPAQAGDVLVLYALGLGATDGNPDVGVPAPGAGNVSQPIAVTIGGVKVASNDLLYAGVSPGYTGLYQINLRVPQGVPAGNASVIVQVGTNSSPSGAYLVVK